MAPGPTDFDNDDSLPLGCPKCNAPMAPNDDLCDSCGYHLVLKKVIDISDMKKPNKTTGFERVFQEQLSESETSYGALLMIKIVAGFVLLAILFFCLGRWWWIGVLVSAAAIGIYVAAYKKRVAQRAAGDDEVNQDPVSAILWSMLLVIQRILGWRKLEWPFPRASSLTMRIASFGDDEFSELSGLADMEALDLEGSGLTDNALQQLRDLKRLRFLVLRHTQVTASAVRRLQQDLPRAMIWH